MNYESRIDSVQDDDLYEDRRSRRRIWMIVAGVAALVIALWFVIHKTGSKTAADANAQAPVVTVVVPGTTTIEGEIGANGSLAAKREMPVGSVGEGGQVRSVLVEAGQWVHAGQVLAVIDRSVQIQQQAAQTAQISVAEANARLAQSNLDRALKLVERGFISKADIDRLTATRDSSLAQVRVARAQTGQIGAQIARLNIVAPASGLLLERKVEPGQVVGGGTGVLFRIAKDGEMEMRALLGEVDMAQMAVGKPADVTPVGSTRKFTGTIWQVSPVIDPQTRQGTVRIQLAYAPELRPGGFATATIKSGTVVAPMLPDSAVLNDNRGAFVYVIGKDNKVERRAVKTGLVTDKGLAIVSGLKGDERVVLRAGNFLNAGETINPVVARQ